MHLPQLSSAYTFISPAPLPTQQLSVRKSAHICMNTKRGATGQKKAPKNKRTSSSGFGSAAKPAKAKNGPTENDPDESVQTDVQFEKPTGAAGDATPHRAMMSGLASASMVNPEKVVSEPDVKLIQLPELSEGEIAELRFERGGLDETVELFADARGQNRFAETIVANRDMVTENLLYRFTSAILQVENRETNLETRDEESRNMRALRDDLISHCWSNDLPLKRELQLAEARLIPVLQGSQVRKDVRRYCGATTLEVDAFWIVIFAAIAAWEEKGKQNPQLINVDMQKQLTAAAEACREVSEVKEKLSPSLKAVQEILSSPDPTLQAKIVEDLDDKIVNHMASLTEQIRLFPTAAYGGLTRKLDDIVSYTLKSKYDFDSPKLVPFRFELPPTKRLSRLVGIGRNALETDKKRRRRRRRW